MDLKFIEQRLPGLAAALVVVLAFLPDYDAFIGDIAQTKSLITLISGVPQELILKHADKLIFVLSLSVGVISLTHSWRYKHLRLVALFSLSICAYGVARLLWAGINLKESLSTRNVSFLDVILIAFATAVAGRNLSVRRGLVYGVLVSATIKLFYSLYVFRTVGGVEMFKGVASFAADGGVLALWGLAALWCYTSANNSLELRRHLPALLWFCLMVVFVIAIGASFRRNIMFRLIGTFGLTTILGGFLYRRTFKAFFSATLAVFAGGALLITTLLMVFGAETALDRIGSLSKSSNSNFANSNETYVDDWQVLPRTFVQHYGLGVGAGRSYGINRMTEELVDAQAGAIPLHTGAFELSASFGVIGLAYQLFVLILIPLLALRSGRIVLRRPDMLLAASVASILWFGLWPFGPPFYVSTAATMLVGIQLGLVCGELELDEVSSADKHAQT